MARHFQPDDRHHISDPYANPAQWAGSVIKTRVSDLFRTLPGLPGHAQQIQQEVQRVVSARNVATSMDGMDGTGVMTLLGAVESIKSAIVSAAKAAEFDFPKFSMDFGFGATMYLEKRGGRLYRDGKPA
jgi:hypothetical protein